MRKNTFYNTVNIKGEQLKKRIEIATTQKEKIYTIFKHFSKKQFTPVQIQDMLGGMLLTSVRRSLTNLTASGKLVKTDKKVDGIYGMPNYTWKLNTNN